MRFRRVSLMWIGGLVLVQLLQGCSGLRPLTLNPFIPKSAPHGEIRHEPTLTSQFIDAYRSGDEIAVEKVASPLYQKEWNRRGISLARRQAWLPSAQAHPDGTSWDFTLTFVDGLVGDDGINHLLYLARSGDQTTGTVWRIDADSSGRVVWAEMVWLFSSDTPALTTVATPSEAGKAALPPPVMKIPPDMLIGVRVSTAWEGFYAARYFTNGRSSVTFFGLDEDGQLRPGAWSYQGTKTATTRQVEIGSRGPGG